MQIRAVRISDMVLINQLFLINSCEDVGVEVCTAELALMAVEIDSQISCL